MLQLQVFILIYFGLSMPFEEKSINRQEIFNEWLNLVFIYHLFLFTDFVPDPETKF